MKSVDIKTLSNFINEYLKKQIEIYILLPGQNSYHQIGGVVKKFKSESPNEIFLSISDNHIDRFYKNISGSSKVAVLLPNSSILFWVEIDSFLSSLIKCTLVDKAQFIERRSGRRIESLHPLELVFSQNEKSVRKLCIDIDEKGFSCVFSKQEVDLMGKFRNKTEITLKYSKLSIKLSAELRSLKNENQMVLSESHVYGYKSSFQILSADKEFYGLLTWLKSQINQDGLNKK